MNDPEKVVLVDVPFSTVLVLSIKVGVVFLVFGAALFVVFGLLGLLGLGGLAALLGGAR